MAYCIRKEQLKTSGYYRYGPFSYFESTPCLTFFICPQTPIAPVIYHIMLPCRHPSYALLPLFLGIAAADGPCDIFVRTQAYLPPKPNPGNCSLLTMSHPWPHLFLCKR